ncbi:MarR family winged helix-turn-helix transcriptional regulator [Arthrobacter sp. NPDC055138]
MISWVVVLDEGEEPRRPEMHAASVLMRKVLVLNDKVEYQMRRVMGTNETDFQAMQHLMAKGPMTPSQLADVLHITTAAATTVVDRLVRADHARRVPHPLDRRSTMVEPTAHAADFAMAKLMPMIQQTDQMVRDMQPDQQEAVVAYLGGVIQAMEQHIVELAGEQPVVPQLTGKGPS